MTPDDEKFLRRAVELASKAGASGERPFGSLLVGADGTSRLGNRVHTRHAVTAT